MKTLIASLLACCVATSAWADSEANVSLTGIRYTLVDLDLNDGVTPSLTFASDDVHNSRADTTSWVWGENPYAWVNDSSTGQGLLSPTSVSASTAGSTSAASVSGDGTLSGTVVQASGSATSSATNTYGYIADSGVLANNLNTYTANAFTLSANTGVTFYADVEGFARVFDGIAPLGLYPGATDQAVAEAMLFVFDQGGEFTHGPQFAMDRFGVGADVEDGWAPGQTEDATFAQQTLTVSFLNTTGADMLGGLSVGASVYGQAAIAVVPEASSVVISLAGLAMVAGWQRRQFKRALA